MKLSIIIVNYKTPLLILDCIHSVYQFATENVEIIVVDNFSNDNTEILLQQHFPGVKFLQMNYNAGFARANNAGIAIAEGEVLLLLNSDTIVKDDAINKALNKLGTSADYIACGVQLLNEDGSPQISGNYAMKGGLNYLLPLPYLGQLLKGIAFLLKVKKTNVPNASGLVEVDWINGAFLMVKKSAIEKAGLLDEDFFLYAEEAEWCSRLKKAGRLCIYGDEHVIHLQGGSANDAFESKGKGYFNLFDKKGFQIMLSNFVRIRKEFGIGWFLFDLLFYILAIPVFFFGVLVEKIFFGKKSRYSFRQLGGFLRNVFLLMTFTAKIISNKPYFYKVL